MGRGPDAARESSSTAPGRRARTRRGPTTRLGHGRRRAPTAPSAGARGEQRGPSRAAGGSADTRPPWKTAREALARKTRPALIAGSSSHAPRRSHRRTKTCFTQKAWTGTFTAALFTIAETWKTPSVGEW